MAHLSVPPSSCLLECTAADLNSAKKGSIGPCLVHHQLSRVLPSVTFSRASRDRLPKFSAAAQPVKFLLGTFAVQSLVGVLLVSGTVIVSTDSCPAHAVLVGCCQL